MQTDRVFRLAAIAWFATVVARVLVVLLQLGPAGTDLGSLVLGSAIGAALGLIVAWLLWTKPTRRNAWIASIFGIYAVIGVLYAPLIGPQPWFILLTACGLVAFILSIACLVVTRRAPGGGTGATG